MLIDYITAFKQRFEYKNNIKKSQQLSIITELLSSNFDKSVTRTKHPFHDSRLEEYKKRIKGFHKKDVNLNFGDSLTDLSRKQIERVHDGVFSISGSWAHHMEQMIIDTEEDLKNFNVKNVSIGCLGGNPMLVYQNFDEVVNDSLSCLNTLRKVHKNSKIIVYGLPPVYNLHVLKNTYQFDEKIMEWVSNDKNSSFINLKAHFGVGWGRLFPDMKWSSDGVHFNPRGGAVFSELIKIQQI